LRCFSISSGKIEIVVIEGWDNSVEEEDENKGDGDDVDGNKEEEEEEEEERILNWMSEEEVEEEEEESWKIRRLSRSRSLLDFISWL